MSIVRNGIIGGGGGGGGSGNVSGPGTSTINTIVTWGNATGTQILSSTFITANGNTIQSTTGNNLNISAGTNNVVVQGNSFNVTCGATFSQPATFNNQVIGLVANGVVSTDVATYGQLTSWTLSDLSGVTITTPANQEVLVYDGGTSTWINQQLSYSSLDNLPTLGTAAALDVGVATGNVVQLIGTGLPVVSGQNLTGITKTQVGLGNVQNVDQTNGSNITSGTVSALYLPVGVSTGNIVQLTSTGLPAVSGQNLTGLTSAQVGLGNVQNVDQTNATNITTGTINAARLPVVPVSNGGTGTGTALNNNRMMISSGGTIQEGAALTNGQIFIGSTGVAPVASTITGTANQIAVTNGAGTIGLSLVTKPSFFAFLTTTTAAITGDGTLSTVIFDNDSTGGGFDNGGGYNNATGVFTAPIAGIYAFQISIRMVDVIVGNTAGSIQLNYNNATRYYSMAYQNIGVSFGAGGAIEISGVATIPLSANDTVRVDVVASGNASKNVAVGGVTVNFLTSYFGGFLITT